MFGNAFGWPHLIVILAVVLLLFGAPKLPGLARSIGQSMRIFRSEVKTMKDENAPVAEEDEEPEAPQASAAKSTPAKSTTAKAAPKSTKPKP